MLAKRVQLKNIGTGPQEKIRRFLLGGERDGLAWRTQQCRRSTGDSDDEQVARIQFAQQLTHLMRSLDSSSVRYGMAGLDDRNFAKPAVSVTVFGDRYAGGEPIA